MTAYKSQYNAIRHKIISSRNPSVGVHSFFKSASLETLKRFSRPLCRDPFFRVGLVGTPFPDDITKLESCGNLYIFDSLEKSLLWFALSFTLYAKEINQFLSLRANFEHAFLLGKYEECMSLLCDCHQKFGWSLWEIERRIAVLTEQSGNDEQKKYASEIIDMLQSHRLLPYLISRYSKQCERNSSYNAYLNVIQTDYNRFLSNGSSEHVCKYIIYKANGYDPRDRRKYSHLDKSTLIYFLCEDDKLSLIDRYLSFQDIATDVFAMGNIEMQTLFLPYLQTLSSKIEDSLWGNAIHRYHEKCELFYPLASEQICQAFDLYSEGSYQESLVLTTQLLHKDIAFFPMTELYAKNCLYLPDQPALKTGSCLMDTILSKLRKLFAQQGDIIELQMELLKISSVHWNAAWSRQLLFVLEKYINCLNSSDSVELNNLHSTISLPSDIFWIDEKYLDKYVETTSSAFRESLFVRFALSVRHRCFKTLDDLPIESGRKERYKALLLMEDDSTHALRILNDISCCPEAKPILYEIDSMRVRAALNAGDFLQAMDIFVSAFYQNSNFVYNGHIEHIFQSIKLEEYDVQASIFPSIICSIYFNYYPFCDERDDIVWEMCYEEYLQSRGAETPSELLPYLSKENTDINLLKFLSEVCVPSIMERSFAFDSSGEVLQERIEICRKLVDVDPDYREKYEAEIQRLTKISLIQLARQRMECGKIHIDLESIRMLLVKDVSDSYEQYINFKGREISDRILKIFSADDRTSMVVLSPVNQSDMFRDVVRRIRDLFVADNKYGLDGCLSVRIRHGSLESQLRSCFEKNHLVTKKMADGTYNENSFWVAPNRNFSPRIQTINNIFSDFSAKVDEIITHLKKDLIQIRTEDKQENGLFNFEIDSNLLACLESQAFFDDSSTAFENFMDMMLRLLLEFTEDGLQEVRRVLQTDIDSDFQQALKDLETELQKHVGKDLDFHGLSDQIAKARTDISTELKNISEWFHLDQPDSYPDFAPSVALSISDGKVQPFHPGLELHCDSQGINDHITFKGWTLPYFVDIFTILLDNVVKHSGFSNEATVRISVQKEEGVIRIKAENPVKHGTLDSSYLHEIEMQLKDWEKQDFISKEGGSGLHKLKKVLSADLRCKNTVSISGESDIFGIQIEAELEGVLL